MTLEREDSGGQERDEESDDQMEEDEGFASNAGKAPKGKLCTQVTEPMQLKTDRIDDSGIVPLKR